MNERLMPIGSSEIEKLKKSVRLSEIGVLDIFGFEVLQ